MEYDAINRMRGDRETHEYTQYQVEMLRQKRAQEQEVLKQEALLLRANTEAYFRELEEGIKMKIYKKRSKCVFVIYTNTMTASVVQW